MRVSDLVKDLIFLVGSVECFAQVGFPRNTRIRRCAGGAQAPVAFQGGEEVTSVVSSCTRRPPWLVGGGDCLGRSRRSHALGNGILAPKQQGGLRNVGVPAGPHRVFRVLEEVRSG